MLVKDMSNKGITVLHDSPKHSILQNNDHQSIIYQGPRQDNIQSACANSTLDQTASNCSNSIYYSDSPAMFEPSGTTRNLVLPLPGIHPTGTPQDLPSLTNNSSQIVSSASSLAGLNTHPQYPVSSPQYGSTSNGSYALPIATVPALPPTPTNEHVLSGTSANQVKSQMPSRLPSLPQPTVAPAAAATGRQGISVSATQSNPPLNASGKPMAYIAVSAVDPPLKTEDGKFKCRTCGRLYAQLKHLKRHAIMHTGINPYGCDWCKKRFTRPDICKRHMSTCPVKKNMFEGRYFGGAATDPVPVAGTPSKRVKLDFPFESPPNKMYSANASLNSGNDNGHPVYSASAPLNNRQNAGLMATNYGVAQRVPMQMNQSPIEHYDYSYAAGQTYNQSYYYYPQAANPAAYSPIYTGPQQLATNFTITSPAQQHASQQYSYQQTAFSQQQPQQPQQPVLVPISAPQTPTSTVTSSPPPPGTVAGLGIYLQK